VVGASHSGQDIAYELAETQTTILCGPGRGNIPLRPESRRAHVLLPVLVFIFKHVLTRRTPMGRKEMHEVRLHGGPNLRVKAQDLTRRGVRRHEARMTAVSNGRPVLGDGTAPDVANVVWCTGFRQVFDWIRLPILDEHGWPVEYRGVVDAAPGLFFCGLSYQYAFSSMIFPGIGRDADYVARHIVARSAAATRDSAEAGARALG
jgi:putative flavoprotein involved in K+ transport